MSNSRINSAKTPVYRDTGFHLYDPDQTINAFAEEIDHPRQPTQYIYGRYRNPTIVAVEQELAQLESAKWALLTSSGMSAIDLALSVFQESDSPAPWLFFSEIYGGTISYVNTVLKRRRGVDVRFYEAEPQGYELEKLERLLDTIKPQLIYFEAVSNPMLLVAPVDAIIKMAKARDIKIIVDNTFATPFLWKPLADGADLVIHSVTKYLAGHGSITAGVVCGNDEQLMRDAIEYRKWTGAILSPDDAARLTDQLKTFDIRMRQHCSNALQIAHFLEKHPAVSNVLYPGLASHNEHEYTGKLFGNKGFGGMITFRLTGNTAKMQRKAVHTFVVALQEQIPLIPTLGDVDSSLLPIEAVWGQKYPIPGMIRFSVGIEPVDKLISHLDKALNLLK